MTPVVCGGSNASPELMTAKGGFQVAFFLVLLLVLSSLSFRHQAKLSISSSAAVVYATAEPRNADDSAIYLAGGRQPSFLNIGFTVTRNITSGAVIQLVSTTSSRVVRRFWIYISSGSNFPFQDQSVIQLFF